MQRIIVNWGILKMSWHSGIRQSSGEHGYRIPLWSGSNDEHSWFLDTVVEATFDTYMGSKR